MSLANTISRLAANQIKRYSVALTMTRSTPGAFDPDAGGSTVSTVSQTVYAVVSPASQGTVQAFDNRFEGGTLIETNMRSLTIPASWLTFAPAPGDTVTDLEESTWTVIGSTPQSLQGVVISYTATVRR